VLTPFDSPVDRLQEALPTGFGVKEDSNRYEDGKAMNSQMPSSKIECRTAEPTLPSEIPWNDDARSTL